MSEDQLVREWSVSDIRKLFAMEFGSVANSFEFFDVKPSEWDESADEAARPGVYVYWKDLRVIKIGRSFTNARKRASEHMRDNTGDVMADLREDPDARLLLFTADPVHEHWVAAIEVFFENWLAPTIRSKRRG